MSVHVFVNVTTQSCDLFGTCVPTKQNYPFLKRQLLFGALFGTRLKEHQKAVALSRKDNSALSEHTCQTNHTIAWNNTKIITSNQ